MTSRNHGRMLRQILGPHLDPQRIAQVEAEGGMSCQSCGRWVRADQLVQIGAPQCEGCFQQEAQAAVNKTELPVLPSMAADTEAPTRVAPPEQRPTELRTRESAQPRVAEQVSGQRPKAPAEVTPAQSALEATSGPTGERGRVIGRYELLEKVGVGGMGEVWRANDPRLHRDVAIKLLHSSTTEVDRERFRREARIAASLDHPAIVRTLDAGVEERDTFLVQEFIEGEALATRLARGPMSEDEALRMMRALAGGVAYAHDLEVIHRDLKPANVLLDRGGQPKLTDFGLARRKSEVSELSLTGQILGTPRYMAPETIRNPNLLSVRSDLYGLGTVLYESVTCRPPVTGQHLHQVLFRVAEGDLIPIRDLLPSVSHAFEAITMKLLARDPSARYASADELIADIDRALAGEAVRAVPPVRPLASMAGEQLGPYTFEQRIQSTPQGVVYRAFDREQRARKLVMIMRPLPVEDRPMLEERIEQRRAVSHPNLLEIGQLTWADEGYPLVELPYLKGDGVDTVLREHGPVEPELACEIASQALAGLGALHKAGMVHGHLSPGSILLASHGDGRGQRSWVKLVGSGLDILDHDAAPIDGFTASIAPEHTASMMLRQSLASGGFTHVPSAPPAPSAPAHPAPGEPMEGAPPGSGGQAGVDSEARTLVAQRIGHNDQDKTEIVSASELPSGLDSPASTTAPEFLDSADLPPVPGDWFSPPENRSDAVGDPRVDLYGVGVLFYQLLTGVPPFASWRDGPPTETDRLADVIPLDEARPDVSFPPSLEAVVRRAIARQPANRFQSAAAFRQAIPSIEPRSMSSRLLARLPLFVALVYLLFGPLVDLPRGATRPSINLNPIGQVHDPVGRGLPCYLAGVVGLWRMPAPAVEVARLPRRPVPLAERNAEGYQKLRAYCVAHGERMREDTALHRVNMVRIIGSAGQNAVVSFYMDVTEVTRHDYKVFLDDLAGHFSELPEPAGWKEPSVEEGRLPVTGVSFHDAQLYALWIGKRLPSDAQWQLAAGVRPQGQQPYPWGKAEPTPNHAVFAAGPPQPRGPGPVARHAAGKTAEGVSDLAGNVWEWTRDDAPGLEGYKIIRGGGWRSGPLQLANSDPLFPGTTPNRDAALSSAGLPDVGFRCVLTPRPE